MNDGNDTLGLSLMYLAGTVWHQHACCIALLSIGVWWLGCPSLMRRIREMLLLLIHPASSQITI